jgi:hypothetical protein
MHLFSKKCEYSFLPRIIKLKLDSFSKHGSARLDTKCVRNGKIVRIVNYRF